MIVSMTGFATKTIPLTIDNVSSSLSITIKSLNARFFETTFRLPYLLFNLETKMIKIIKSRLHRGHIYCTINMSNASGFGVQITPCIKTVQSYIQAIDLIKKECGIDQQFNLDHLLRLPNIFDTTDQTLTEQAVAIILQAVNEVSLLVVHERIREGGELLKDIDRHIQIIKREILAIERDAKDLLEKHKEKIRQALHDVSNDEHLTTEVRKGALFTLLDKMDINEEIVRFNAHLHNLVTHLHEPLPVLDELTGVMTDKGKQLDFVLQELAREINTIAAKCCDANIGSLAINIKVAVEKIREQVQNIV